MSATAESLPADPQRFLWMVVWALVMGVGALPLLGYRVPAILPYKPTLVIHEFAAFAFFGHTFFSNIWSMAIRTTQPKPFGIWARALLRRLAMSITGPTTVIVPLFGAMLVDHLGGWRNVPWAWDAYLAFWIVAAISLVPDVIRYARNRNAEDPMHGMLNGGIRAMIATVFVFFIMYTMAAKDSVLAIHLFVD